MAAVNITTGRVNPAITEALITAAQGNAGRYITDALPFHFKLSSRSKFKGFLRTLPVSRMFGDSRAVGTGALRRQSGAQYHSSDLARLFDTTDFECFEHATAEVIDDQDEARSMEDAITVRQGIAAVQYATIKDDDEVQMSAAVFNVSNYATAAVAALTGGKGTAWNAAGGSPSQDGAAVAALIRSQSGAAPDYAVVTWDVVNALRFAPETLGAKVVTSGAVPVGRTNVTADYVLKLWADLWELDNGLYRMSAMKNTADPNATGVLAEINSGKVAFHTSKGLTSAYQLDATVTVAGGPVSLIRISEEGMRGFEDPVVNPHGIQIASKHAFCYAVPGASAATRPAYVLTAVNG